MPKNRVLIITITSGMFVGKRVEPRTPARHLERWNIQQRRPLVGAVGPARAPKPEMVIIL